MECGVFIYALGRITKITSVDIGTTVHLLCQERISKIYCLGVFPSVRQSGLAEVGIMLSCSL